MVNAYKHLIYMYSSTPCLLEIGYMYLEQLIFLKKNEYKISLRLDVHTRIYLRPTLNFEGNQLRTESLKHLILLNILINLKSRKINLPDIPCTEDERMHIPCVKHLILILTTERSLS